MINSADHSGGAASMTMILLHIQNDGGLEYEGWEYVLFGPVPYTVHGK